MNFPMFGICPVCSSNSGDVAQADLTSADAGYAITSDGDNTDVRTVANDYLIDENREGVELVWYRGKKMCHVCKERLEADAESLISASNDARAKMLRSKAGFVSTIE